VSLAVLLGALAVPAGAAAQATRTWVSGTGDDVNPCSRTAPCKTFAGAITKTAPGGEIDAQDPGGFGTVTITKSITISGVGTQASILSSGTNGVVINAGASDHVRLIDLSISGAGTGLNGVRVLAAGTVALQGVHIYDHTQNGVDVESTASSPQTRVQIEDSTIDGNGLSGVLAVPQVAAGERVSIIGSHIDSNGCGIAAGALCTASASNGNPTLVESFDTSFEDNGTGVGGSQPGAAIRSISSTAANIAGGDTVLNNTIGLSRVASGQILSFGDNDIFGNGTDGTSSATLSPHAVTKVWNRLVANARAEHARQTKRRHTH